MTRRKLTTPLSLWLLAGGVLGLGWPLARGTEQEPLRVGFAEVDITPNVQPGPVYLAGFGQNRKATGVLDPLFARAMVLRHGTQTIALATTDLVGLFLPNVEAIRAQLSGYTAVIVSSSHNHHGPDTMGLWGPNPFRSGVDPAYIRRVEDALVSAIRQAERQLSPANAFIATRTMPELLHDARPPEVKHDELVCLQFRSPNSDKPSGLLVQWNCHPETLESKNTLLSSDYVGTTVRVLRESLGCPVIYFTGSVGGLMTSMHVPIHAKDGQKLPEGSVAKTRRYGEVLAERALEALRNTQPIRLEPFDFRRASVVLPVDNRLYKLGKQLKVLDREMELWTGDPYQPRKVHTGELGSERAAIRTEVGYLRLGELEVALIPGEIYPELVLDRIQTPVDPGADFPDAPPEPAIYRAMKGPRRMLIGLANDEIGYILPKSQWDEKPPYTFGQKRPPYGEVNSLGPDTAPILCEAFRKLLAPR